MKEPASTNGHPEGNGHAGTDVTPTSQPVNRIRRKAGHRDVPGLIEHAEQLRTALRATLVKTSELIKAIKQERRQNRVLRSTLAGLRQLKTIGV